MLSKGISGISGGGLIIPFTKTLFYGFAFLVMHDYDHYVTGDWSLEGEITAYKAAASRAPLEIQKILYSNCPQSGCLYLSGTRSEPKTVFRNILQHQSQASPDVSILTACLSRSYVRPYCWDETVDCYYIRP